VIAKTRLPAVAGLLLLALALTGLALARTAPARASESDPRSGYAAAAHAVACSTADALGDPDADGLANAFESTVGSDPCVQDTDGDNCMDGNEIWFDPNFGGDRALLSSDFYDTDGNASINLADTVAILAAFGTPGTDPAAQALDRYAPDPAKPWRAAPADNGIGLTDALLNLRSFGHDCATSTLIPQCPAGMIGVKFDSPFGAGTIGPITVLNVVYVDGEPKFFDWTSTVGIDFVYVKASTTYTTYAYNPEAFHDEGLFGPEGPSGPRGISHVLFCYDDDSGTATPTPTATSTPGGNTATPTHTPGGSTATPTHTPGGNTATPTPTRTSTPGGNTATPTPTPGGNTATPTPTRTSTPGVGTATPTPTRTSTPSVGTATPTPTATNTPGGSTATPTSTPGGPCVPTPEPTPARNGLVKSIDCRLPGTDTLLVNLWLCYDQAVDALDNNGDSTVDNEPHTCLNNGEGRLHVDERIYSLVDCDTRNDDDDLDGKPVSNDPASPGYRAECPAPTAEDFLLNLVDKDGGELPEGLGAFEFQLKFDHKIFDILITEWAEWANGRNINCSITLITENDIRFGCISTGSQLGLAQARGEIGAKIWIFPEDDLRYRIRPSKDNMVVRRILDENCEIADIYGDIFPGTNAGLTPDCTDLDITVRRLEGDVDIDCDVDAVDAALMNWRFQSFFGSGYYDPNYDLEPWPNGDYDIDIKDLQFVNGRIGSTCRNPIPNNQNPMPAYIVALP